MSRPLQLSASYSAVVGAILQHRRERKGLQQAELARLGMMSQSTVSRIERGVISASLEQLVRITELLGTSPGVILTEADHTVQQIKRQGVRVNVARPTAPLSDGEVAIGAAALLLLVAAALGKR
jgi:transcriptional regulator with XRE-family HTH domain